MHVLANGLSTTSNLRMKRRIAFLPDASSTGLSRDETNVVNRSKFAKGKEDTVDDDETGDVLGLVERLVAAGHDVADDSLADDTDDEDASRGELGHVPQKRT